MEALPRLSRELVLSGGLDGRAGLEVAPVATLGLPEKIAQFGTGAFLRGFIEAFVDDANRAGIFNGSIVAVSSTGSSRNTPVNEQGGLFTLANRGVEDGAPKQRYRIISSLSRALSAREQWSDVLELARSPDLQLVVSNTTEVGISLDPADAFDGAPPMSFPAKLTRFLSERANAFEFDRTAGVVVLPCELIDGNGDTLRALVHDLAARWSLDERFVRWIDESVVFCNTLVDRIVPGVVSHEDAGRVGRVFGYNDELITACEPYALFAIQGDAALRDRLGFAGNDSRIVVAPDIQPYRERKIRVLNGGHSILVPAALLAGFANVREASTDERMGRFLRRAMFDEIVPTLDAPDAAGFAREVIDRFANPYIQHALIDITLHGTAKMRVRVVPSIIAFEARLGQVPSSLAFGFAGYLAFMRGGLRAEREGAGLSMPPDAEGERVRDAWSSVNLSCEADIIGLARSVCSEASLWGVDLTAIGGFADAVADHLVRIVRDGIQAALDAHLIEPATT